MGKEVVDLRTEKLLNAGMFCAKIGVVNYGTTSQILQQIVSYTDATITA
jgi:threonine dehydratase